MNKKEYLYELQSMSNTCNEIADLIEAGNDPELAQAIMEAMHNVQEQAGRVMIETALAILPK